MLNTGLEYMIIGMVTVFAFLVVLVFVMKLTYQFVQVFNKFFPEKEEQAASAPAAQSGNDAELAVALAAAYSMKNN